MLGCLQGDGGTDAIRKLNVCRTSDVLACGVCLEAELCDANGSEFPTTQYTDHLVSCRTNCCRMSSLTRRGPTEADRTRSTMAVLAASRNQRPMNVCCECPTLPCSKAAGWEGRW